MKDPDNEKPIDYDPIFLNSRREAIVIFMIWLVCLVWSVPYCYCFGYVDSFDAASFSTILGVPSWLFWGIALPWLLADIVTTWFCFCYMKDDDVGVADDELPANPDKSSLPKEDAS
jgi:hypothetical protein